MFSLILKINDWWTPDIRKEETLEIANEPLVLSIEFYPPQPYPISTFCANQVKQLIHHEKDLPTSMKFNELYQASPLSFSTFEYNIRKMNFDMGGFHLHFLDVSFIYHVYYRMIILAGLKC